MRPRTGKRMSKLLSMPLLHSYYMRNSRFLTTTSGLRRSFLGQSACNMGRYSMRMVRRREQLIELHAPEFSRRRCTLLGNPCHKTRHTLRNGFQMGMDRSVQTCCICLCGKRFCGRCIYASTPTALFGTTLASLESGWFARKRTVVAKV